MPTHEHREHDHRYRERREQSNSHNNKARTRTFAKDDARQVIEERGHYAAQKEEKVARKTKGAENSAGRHQHQDKDPCHVPGPQHARFIGPQNLAESASRRPARGTGRRVPAIALPPWSPGTVVVFAISLFAQHEVDV
jgi:hypothetical protein